MREVNRKNNLSVAETGHKIETETAEFYTFIPILLCYNN